MIPGETVLSGAAHPGTTLRVLQSSAGYYLGYLDKDGTPYSRESRYFGDRASAVFALSLLRGGSDCICGDVINDYCPMHAPVPPGRS